MMDNSKGSLKVDLKAKDNLSPPLIEMVVRTELESLAVNARNSEGSLLPLIEKAEEAIKPHLKGQPIPVIDEDKLGDHL